MEGVNKVALPVWLVGVLGAWALSYEAGAAATVGLLAQWALKAPKNVPDWVPPAVVVVVCLALWTLLLGHMPKTFPPPHQWLADFIEWAGMAFGVASASGHTGGAPKTNSI